MALDQNIIIALASNPEALAAYIASMTAVPVTPAIGTPLPAEPVPAAAITAAPVAPAVEVAPAAPAAPAVERVKTES